MKQRLILLVLLSLMTVSCNHMPICQTNVIDYTSGITYYDVKNVNEWESGSLGFENDTAQIVISSNWKAYSVKREDAK